MRMTTVAQASVCVLIVAAACAAAQIVEGTVTNVATGGGLAGAKVALQQADQVAYSAITAQHRPVMRMRPGL